MRRLSPIVLALAACGGTEAPPPGPYIEGFNPPAVREGFERFIAPPVEDIAPGSDQAYCQWLAEASTEEIDIIEAEGMQTEGGHHLVLYATTLKSPVGTTRPCTDADQVSLRYLGAIGGEGVTGAEGKLPPGVVYRLPKGWALMANTHYVNYTTKPLTAQSYIDIKKVPADPSAKVASLFASTVVDGLEIPPGIHTIDVSCEMQEDLPLLLAGNHMHDRGKSVRSQVRKPDGTVEIIRDDPIWSPENVFAPDLVVYPGDAPRVLKKGDILETRCTWDNQEGKTIGFPTEMCVTFGFYLGSGVQINCVSGHWEI